MIRQTGYKVWNGGNHTWHRTQHGAAEKYQEIRGYATEPMITRCSDGERVEIQFVSPGRYSLYDYHTGVPE